MGDSAHLKGPMVKGKMVGDRKHQNTLKDVKKKLCGINTKIGDLHHQRKNIYRNSVKVKKMVHNQVNQIVKCLRARERNIWCEVDDSFNYQDSNISNELTKLQSVHASCQALVDHLDGCKDKSGILETVSSILSQVKIEKSPEVKPFGFLSDFQAMKARAENYGCLLAETPKKNNLMLVEDKDDIFDERYYYCKLFKFPVGKSPEPIEKHPYKITDNEDFQIIDLLDNMNCQDSEEDFVMAEDVSVKSSTKTEKEYSTSSTCEDENEFVKVSSKSFCETPKICYNSLRETPTKLPPSDFNPEEEWRNLIEMNRQIANFFQISSRLPGENKVTDTMNFHHGDLLKREAKIDLKNSKQNTILDVKEADLNSRKYIAELEKTTTKRCKEKNCPSPADMIQMSFKPYFIKNDCESWLSSYNTH